jgi:hypothetical protein
MTGTETGAISAGAFSSEGAAPEPVRDTLDASAPDHTVELSTAELVQAAASSEPADEVGATVVGIPLRNQLAAARIAHALANARDAQALIDEAVELLATVRGLHAETYQLGAARGGLRDTIDLLAGRSRSAEGDAPKAEPPFDLKADPSYEEIATWVSFGIPVTS